MIDIDDCTVQGSVNDLTGDELYQSQQIDDTFNDDIAVGSEWVQKKKTPKEFEVVVLSGDSLMVKENGESFFIPWYTSDFLEHHEPKVKADMVNHPPHYKDASGIECIEVTKNMQFCGGNCFKYLYRAGKKGSTVEDLKKAAWYAERAWIMNESVSDEASRVICDVAMHREGNILEAMVSIECSEWDNTETYIKAEIARLESE